MCGAMVVRVWCEGVVEMKVDVMETVIRGRQVVDEEVAVAQAGG